MSSRFQLEEALQHASPLDEVVLQLAAEEAGLATDEARRRLDVVGPNELPHRAPPTKFEIILRQFKSPLIYILVVAGVVSLLLRHPEDTIFIGIVLVLNAAIGSFQEWRAEVETRALQSLLRIHASVLRDGELVEVDAGDLVPGDVVLLESGFRVPADLRLFAAQGLEVDESFLTGESLAVTKDADWIGDERTPVGDRRNMAFAGAIVVRGRGRGYVAATGHSTVVGKLAVDVSTAEGGRAPVVERMERFSYSIAHIVLVAVTVVALIGVFVRGHAPADMFLFGVALAVSAIPEGLPVALTVAFAVATSRMAKRRVVVRRLSAVEGLGSCTYIGSDKTGTLTCNELTVRAAVLADGTSVQVTGEGFAPVGEIAGGVSTALERLAAIAAGCNEGDLHESNGEWAWHGDPTDVALLAFARKAGVSRTDLIERHPQHREIPFEPEIQYAATFHADGPGELTLVKGSPERVLAMCALDASEQDRRLATAAELASQGYRVLALADRRTAVPTEGEPSDLDFVGFVGMIDPLRPGAAGAVAACRDAGIVVTMITGDHPVTALAIARDLGLAERMDQVVSGAELSEMSEDELREAVRTARVFARAAPRQKLEIVQMAQAKGHYVAVTGDGVNDAPALHQANIGVAMGKSGTDIAREAADLVITDDEFSTIVAGVEEGRVAYDNVRKVVYLLVSTGAAEVLLLALAIFTGWPRSEAGFVVLPLLPAQILWLNLVTNGIQDVALAFEPSEGEVLRRMPRPPKEPIFNRLMIERSLVAAVFMAGVGFSVFVWMVEALGTGEDEARNLMLLLMVLFQAVHIGNCRSETKSAFIHSPFRSPILLAGTITAFSVHMLAMNLPITQRLLRTEPVTFENFGLLLACAVCLFIVMEVHKFLWNRRARRDAG